MADDQVVTVCSGPDGRVHNWGLNWRKVAQGHGTLVMAAYGFECRGDFNVSLHGTSMPVEVVSVGYLRPPGEKGRVCVCVF